jgi:hypothetical protein
VEGEGGGGLSYRASTAGAVLPFSISHKRSLLLKQLGASFYEGICHLRVVRGQWDRHVRSFKPSYYYLLHCSASALGNRTHETTAIANDFDDPSTKVLLDITLEGGMYLHICACSYET